MTEQTPKISSPTWGTNTKLVVALTVVVSVGALLVKFQFILGPLMISFLLAYLLHPLAGFLYKKLRFSWGAAVGVIYLLFVILLISLLTWGGVSLVQQGQSVLATVQESVATLPQLVEEYSNKVFQLGPFEIDLRTVDLGAISEQALNAIQPLLSQTGALLGSLAGGAANVFGWTIFVLFVSYFVVAESGGLRSQIITVDIPGYTYDVARLMRELSRIWNAFMRGQIIIFFMTILIYIAVLELLGVRYAITLAFIAGLARFLPYVGPAINWVILVLITYFQEYHLFGLSAFYYSLLVLSVTVIIDMVIDYMITPRIYSDTLQVHPAAVLVAAIVAASLFGVLGVIVSAPILATSALLWQYTMRKMLDVDPWLEEEKHIAQPSLLESARGFFSKLGKFFKKK